MLGYLKSPQSTSAVTEAEQVDEMYRYWRFHIMFTMYIGYAVFYLTRKSFNYAMPAMIADLGLDKADIGMMGTLFYITYGCSISLMAALNFFLGSFLTVLTRVISWGLVLLRQEW